MLQIDHRLLRRTVHFSRQVRLGAADGCGLELGLKAMAARWTDLVATANGHVIVRVRSVVTVESELSCIASVTVRELRDGSDRGVTSVK